MDLTFITRSLKMTAVLAVLAYLFATVYVGVNWGFGFLLGALWGIANLYLLKTLIARAVTLADRDWMAIAVFMLIKFPLLYVAGYLIISRSWYDTWAPVAGFSLSLIVIVLKAAGRVIMRLDDPQRDNHAANLGMKR